MYPNLPTSTRATPHATVPLPPPVALPPLVRRPMSGLSPSVPADCAARWLVLGRHDALGAGARGFTVWVQVRGRTRLNAREGEFELGPGDWLALDRDSAPELQSGRHGLTVGLVLPAEIAGRGRPELLAGRGRMTSRDLRMALRLWRMGRRLTRESGADGAAAQRGLQALLAHLAAVQRELDPAIARCPGRSIRRKRQVFGRLQRARLFLEGHRHRVVRLTELAELTSFSSWYLSKTFHAIYDESPQASSVRLRLERACELLAQSDCSIGEVGAACGFDNSCSFARAFRARFGVTASAYRESSRAARKA